MATKPKRPKLSGYAYQRELIELAKTMDLAAIVKKTGRKPKAILEIARRLGISIRT
jgi:hypothetical protein